MAVDKIVIVESPAKAKTISKFLPDAYVTASKGHIRDLPKGHGLGISINGNNFIPTYEVTADHKAIVADLKSHAKGKKVYIATDEDREGEAIGYHIACILGGDPTSYDRIAFHEITKTAILKAIANPRKLHMDSVHAQEARRMLDRIVGFKLSPLLSNKVAAKLSAGRVQSAALKIVYDKEQEIRAFKPITYYDFPITVVKDIPASLYEYLGNKIQDQSVREKSTAEEILKALKANSYPILSIESSTKKSSPKEPFRTSTLQQVASNELGFNPDRTMSTAQKLYEGVDIGEGRKGLITYMRTDSLNLAEEAVQAIREQILSQFGEKYLAPSIRVYQSKAKGAQEAHEAIRVTDITLTPEKVKKYLEPDLLKLYKLIWNRTMMCQMSDALTDNTTVIAGTNQVKIKVSGRQVKFDGWTILKDNTKEDVILPNWKVNDLLQLQEASLEEKQTKAPARYTPASLVKTLEDLGIGRPSTYASIIKLLISRNYILVQNKSMSITESGEKIILFLDKYFKEITDSNFTSKMEEQLDEIALGKKTTNQVLSEFCLPLIEKVSVIFSTVESTKDRGTPTGQKCPTCKEGELLKIKGRFGEFLGCSRYPKCKHIGNLNPTDPNIPAKVPDEPTGKNCPECGKPVFKKTGKFGVYYACESYPKLKHTWKTLEAIDKPEKQEDAKKD